MRLFHWLVTTPLALVLVVFAVSNRVAITLNFWPMPVTLQAPAYLIVLIALLAGFLIGAMAAWINGRHWRRDARHSARRVEELEREIAAKSPAKDAAKELTGP